MKRFSTIDRSEDGNILFIILITVMLFAALSYAVTQSSRGGSKGAGEERVGIEAARILQYVSHIDQAVLRLRVSEGCRAVDSGVHNELTFESDSDGDGDWNESGEDYHNPGAPTDHSCHVFHPDGGGVYADFEVPDEFIQHNGWNVNATVQSWYDNLRGKPLITGQFDFDGAGTPELMLVIPFLTEALCAEMNKKLTGQDAPPPFINLYLGWLNMKWPGYYNGYGGTIVTSNNSACVWKNNDNFYIFYHVLIAR